MRATEPLPFKTDPMTGLVHVVVVDKTRPREQWRRKTIAAIDAREQIGMGYIEPVDPPVYKRKGPVDWSSVQELVLMEAAREHGIEGYEDMPRQEIEEALEEIGALPNFEG